MAKAASENILILLKGKEYPFRKDYPCTEVSLFRVHRGLFLKEIICCKEEQIFSLTLLHSEWPKLNGVLAILNAVGLRVTHNFLKSYL